MDTVTALPRPAPQVPADCPVDRTMRVLNGRWKALILFNLAPGPCRFNQLRRLIPAITQRMLTQHLRELENDGIVARHVHNVVPPHVEYSFTPLGLTLMPILEAMADWGQSQQSQDAGVAA